LSSGPSAQNPFDTESTNKKVPSQAEDNDRNALDSKEVTKHFALGGSYK